MMSILLVLALQFHQGDEVNIVKVSYSNSEKQLEFYRCLVPQTGVVTGVTEDRNHLIAYILHVTSCKTNDFLYIGVAPEDITRR